ncbi:hypothetical protein BHE74_00008038 [Ensete ventricosum]|nr:hypothetical protein BHE74_00008038 [Ensete ventricosum]RZS15513.1 hypothetical protein BHM03_00047348 [Ensete ventricosum]
MEQNLPEARSETPSIISEKSTAPHLGEEHTPQELDTLSSDSTNSFRMQLRRINEWLDKVQNWEGRSPSPSSSIDSPPKHERSPRASLFSYPSLSNGNMPVQTVMVFGRKTSDHSPQDDVEGKPFHRCRNSVRRKA